MLISAHRKTDLVEALYEFLLKQTFYTLFYKCISKPSHSLPATLPTQNPAAMRLSSCATWRAAHSWWMKQHWSSNHHYSVIITSSPAPPGRASVTCTYWSHVARWWRHVATSGFRGRQTVASYQRHHIHPPSRAPFSALSLHRLSNGIH